MGDCLNFSASLLLLTDNDSLCLASSLPLKTPPRLDKLQICSKSRSCENISRVSLSPELSPHDSRCWCSPVTVNVGPAMVENMALHQEHSTFLAKVNPSEGAK